MIPTFAHCLRDGIVHRDTLVSNIVKGDIVYVYSGDIVPADIRILESKGFKVLLLL